MNYMEEKHRSSFSTQHKKGYFLSKVASPFLGLALDIQS